MYKVQPTMADIRCFAELDNLQGMLTSVWYLSTMCDFDVNLANFPGIVTS